MNLLSTIMKQSEQIYYTKYFESNWNNIKNTWNRIKSIIKYMLNILINIVRFLIFVDKS